MKLNFLWVLSIITFGLLFLTSCNKVDVDYSASNFNNLKFTLVGENSSNNDIKLYRNQIFTIDYRKKDKIKSDLKIKMEYSLIDNSQLSVNQVLSEYKTEDVLKSADELLKFKIKVQESLPSNEFLNLKIKFSVEDNSVEFVPSELVIKIDNSTLPPSAVTILTPPSNSYINVSNVGNYEITGTCGEGNSIEISSASPQTMVLFPGPLPCLGGTFSTGSMDLAGFIDGNVQIDFKQKNTLGESSPVTSLNLIKDTVLPVVTVLNPADNAVIDTSSVSTFNINGTCTEDGRPVIISGDIAPLMNPNCSAGTWSVVLDTGVMGDGAFNLIIKQTDISGNQSLSVTRSLIKSSSGIIAIISNVPAGFTNVNTFNLTISGTNLDGYKYALGKGINCATAAYSNLISIASPITKTTDPATGNLLSSTLAEGNGLYRVCVIGKTTGGSFQDVTAASSAAWTFDNVGPVLSIIDDGSYLNSNSVTPEISWGAATDATSGVAEYFIAIGTSAGGNDVLNWTSAGSSTSFSTNLGLSYGTKYYATVKAVDLANNSTTLQGDGWWSILPLDLSPTSINLIAGETFNFVASQGLPTYSATSIVGLINSVTLLYSVPLGTPPTMDTVTVTDSVGQVKVASVNIRAFQDKHSYSYYEGSSGGIIVKDIKSHFGGFLFTAGTEQDNQGNNVWTIKKSTDGGATWMTVDRYALVSNKTSTANALHIDASGHIYVTGYAIDINNKKHCVLRKSTNNGDTWNDISVFQFEGGNNTEGLDLTVVGSKILVVGAGFSSAESAYRGFVVEMNLDGSSRITKDQIGSGTFQHSQINSIFFDSFGKLYVAGFMTVSGSRHWIVRKSSDSGASWVNMDDFQDSVSHFEAKSIEVDTLGRIYVVGYGYYSSNSSWIVRMSSDEGLNWNTIDNYEYFPSKNSVAINLTTDASGNIYVVGYAQDVSDIYQLIIRKFDGSSWSNKAIFQLSSIAGYYAQISAICWDGGYLVAAGYGYNNSYWNRKVIRKSSDSGETWPVNNQYNNLIRPDNIVNDMIETLNGNIYAAGSVGADNFVKKWQLQQTSNAGNSWLVADEFQLAANRSASANTISVNPANGNLFISGTAVDESSVNHWITRRSLDSGSSFIDSDNFNHQTGYASIANGSVVDSGGNIYVVGYGMTSSSGQKWIVRKSTDQGDTWITVDAYNIGMYPASAKAVLSNGVDIFVVGNVQSGSTNNAVIRKSSDGGSSWVEKGSYQYAPFQLSEYNSIVRDSFGNLYVSGTFVDSAGVKHWLIRKSTDNGDGFTNLVDYNFAPGKDSEVHKLSVDAAGNIYAAGEMVAADGTRYWVLQKSKDQGVSWRTIDKKSISNKSTSLFKGLVPCLSDRLCTGISEEESFFLGKKWRFRILSF